LVPGSAFEAVDVSSLMVASGSGQTTTTSPPPAPPPPPPPPVTMYTLTVSVTGGPGTVTSSPAGIRCTAGACGASFPAGTRVTLTPSGGRFRYWSGACSGQGSCVVTLTKSLKVVARFRP
jgi:hypothetical protein